MFVVVNLLDAVGRTHGFEVKQCRGEMPERGSDATSKYDVCPIECACSRNICLNILFEYDTFYDIYLPKWSS